MKEKEIREKLESLEGEEFFIIMGDNSKKVGVISGADYDIGVSVQNKYNKDEYLFCISGKYDPKRRYDTWDEDFAKRVKCLYEIFIKYAERDIFYINSFYSEVHRVEGLNFGDASAETCPFNQ